ncbi:succinate dehydrogenase cytochrome b subunit [Marssonina coronariae]|uniref:Succinate dehydrogenase cytochrome b subunit n=1 Tax=Diplocarpon coronariae TaxID=2795749 RepID=A0A218ZEV9_9HELO|nr:succinate dehydrogenase cytochrome b subunit [Marssonina coronariae]
MAGASRTGSTTTTTKSNFSTRSRHPHRISHNWTSNILTQRRRHDVSTTSYSAGDAQARHEAISGFADDGQEGCGADGSRIEDTDQVRVDLHYSESRYGSVLGYEHKLRGPGKTVAEWYPTASSKSVDAGSSSHSTHLWLPSSHRTAYSSSIEAPALSPPTSCRDILILKPTNMQEPVATQKMTSADSYEILVAQRKLRPTSPNLGIYKPQITWILSSLNRITGLSVSVPFYLFGLAYLASPLLGWHLDSATLASTFGALPVAAKVGLKALAALPFTFHSWNGIRHLVWDTGRAFNNQTVIRSGWAVVGLTAASTLYLAFAY